VPTILDAMPTTADALQKHRALYGDLDPFAVAPFVTYGGEPLSNDGRRLASLLNRAMRGRLPITAEIRFELVHFLSAPFNSDPTRGIHQRLYDLELHRQKLIALLERYGRRTMTKRVSLVPTPLEFKPKVVARDAPNTDQPDGEPPPPAA
jgi:hypothetical protein